jgi:hypothetical protein
MPEADELLVEVRACRADIQHLNKLMVGSPELEGKPGLLQQTRMNTADIANHDIYIKRLEAVRQRIIGIFIACTALNGAMTVLALMWSAYHSH